MIQQSRGRYRRRAIGQRRRTAGDGTAPAALAAGVAALALLGLVMLAVT